MLLQRLHEIRSAGSKYEEVDEAACTRMACRGGQCAEGTRDQSFEGEPASVFQSETDYEGEPGREDGKGGGRKRIVLWLTWLRACRLVRKPHFS